MTLDTEPSVVGLEVYCPTTGNATSVPLKHVEASFDIFSDHWTTRYNFYVSWNCSCGQTHKVKLIEADF
jgi:hypothetical protein